MKEFINHFFSVLDRNDKKSFLKYAFAVLFFSSFNLLGIGAIIPFMQFMLNKQTVLSYSFFYGWDYLNVMLFMTGILIVAYLLKNLAAFILLSYQSSYLASVTAKVQKKLFSGYMRNPYEFHLSRSTPNLIKILNTETGLFSTNITAQFGIFFSEFISSIIIFCLLVYINPGFSLGIFSILVISMILFMRGIRQQMMRNSELRTNSWTNINDAALSGLSGIKEAKLYGCEEYYIQKYNFHVEELKRATKFVATYQQAPRMVIEFAGISVVMMTLCFYLSLGYEPLELMILLSIFGVAAVQLLPSCNRMNQAMVLIKFAMPALKTIRSELHAQATINKKKQTENQVRLSLEKYLEFRNVSFSYIKSNTVLSNINFKIKKGQNIAFVGASGAGKTTCVDMLLGLFLPCSGSIAVDNIEVNDENKTKYQSLFSYIPQTIVLFDKSIKENIALGVEEQNIDKARVLACIKSARLFDFVNGLENKEDTFVGEGGVRLSGGQRQRLGIARALYHKSKVLVMDEATSALDYQTEKELVEIFDEQKALTVVTIAHRLTTIKNYDVIYVFDKGCIIARGCYGHLLESCDSFRQMVHAAEREMLQSHEVDFKEKSAEEVGC